GWAEYARALPAGWTAERLRRRLLERQLTVDLTIWSTGALLEAPSLLRAQAATALRHSSAGEFDRAFRAASKLVRMTELDSGFRSAAIGLSRALEERAQQAVPPPLSEELHAVPGSDFQAAASLTELGTLPGSPSVSTDVAARGGRWNPFSQVKATTRQAVQVTVAGLLAILAGTAINGQRYYWAVIAAFVAFTGTGTRMETFNKSLSAYPVCSGIVLAWRGRTFRGRSWSFRPGSAMRRPAWSTCSGAGGPRASSVRGVRVARHGPWPGAAGGSAPAATIRSR